MKKYLVKRILSVIPILFIVSLVVFFLIHMTPGDPARVMLGDEATEEEVYALREQLGFNNPLPVQYVDWILGIFRGDFGTSFFMQGSMKSILMEHIKPTLYLTIYAIIIAVGVAIPLGLAAAKHRGRWADSFVTGFSLLGISIPAFLTGILLMLLFGSKLRWFPTAGYKEPTDNFLKFIKYLTLPAISLGLMQVGLITRVTRSAALEVMNSDYIKMAKAKGVKGLRLMTLHVLHSCILPILTVIGQSMILLLSGATVTETIFNIPGLGQLVMNCIERRDYEVIQAVVLLIAVINVFVMLLVDILSSFLDPRVRMED